MAGQTYSVSLTNLESSFSYISLVINDGITDVLLEGTSRSMTVVKATNETYEFVPTHTGRISIKIYPYYDNHYAEFYAYQLAVYPASNHGLIQDISSFEPNNTASMATPLRLQMPVASELTGNEDYFDYYSLDVVAGQAYSVSFSNLDTSYNHLDLVINDGAKDMVFDGGMTFIRGAKDTNSVYQFVPTQTGSITIKVASYSSDYYAQYFSYQLAIYPLFENGLVQDITSFEPNNTVSMATPLLLQTPVTSELTGNEDYLDYYTLDVVAGETYSVSLSNLATSYSHIYLVINNGAADLVLEGDNNYMRVVKATNKFYEFTATQSGPLTLKIYPEGGYIAQNYFYQLAIYPAIDKGLIQDDLSFEPNNTASMATSVSLQTLVSSELSGGVDYVDYYSLDVVAGQTYNMMLSNLAVSYAHLYLVINDGSTNLVLEGSNAYMAVEKGITEIYEFKPIKSGRITIKINSSSAYFGNYFGYEFIIYPSTDNGLLQSNISFEPNNTPSMASPFQLQSIVNSELTGIDDHIDYYSTEVVAGQVYTISLTNLANSYHDIYLRINDGASDFVLESGSLNMIVSKGQTEAYEFVPTQSGKITLRIFPITAYNAQYFAYEFNVSQ